MRYIDVQGTKVRVLPTREMIRLVADGRTERSGIEMVWVVDGEHLTSDRAAAMIVHGIHSEEET